MVLAAGSVFAGFVPFTQLVTPYGATLQAEFHWNVALVSIVIALTGISVAWKFYGKPSELPDRIIRSVGNLYQLVYRKFYMDEIYLFITKKVIFRLFAGPIAWFDRHIVDGTMNGIAWTTRQVSVLIKGLQSGQLQKYAFIFLAGALLFVLTFLYLINY